MTKKMPPIDKAGPPDKFYVMERGNDGVEEFKTEGEALKYINEVILRSEEYRDEEPDDEAIFLVRGELIPIIYEKKFTAVATHKGSK